MSGFQPFLFTGSSIASPQQNGYTQTWPFAQHNANDSQDGSMQVLPGLGSFSDLPGLGEGSQANGNSRAHSHNGSVSSMKGAPGTTTFGLPSVIAPPPPPHIASTPTPQPPPSSATFSLQPPASQAFGLPLKPLSNVTIPSENSAFRRSPSNVREEGEVSDSESVDISSPRHTNGPHVTTNGVGAHIKKSMTAQAESSQKEPQKNYHTQSIARKMSESNGTTLGSTHASSPIRDDVTHKRDGAKEFLRLMHKNGYGYQQFVQEPLNPKILRSLYDDLGLDTVRGGNKPLNGGHTPSFPASTQQTPVVSTQPPSAVPGHKTKDKKTSSLVSSPGTTKPIQQSSVSITEAISPASALPVDGSGTGSRRGPSPTAQSQAAPKDRKEYIARLMAAKTKRGTPPAASASKSTTPTAVTVATQAPIIPQNGTKSLVEPVALNVKRQANLARLREQAMETARANSAKLAKQREAGTVEIATAVTVPNIVDGEAQQPMVSASTTATSGTPVNTAFPPLGPDITSVTSNKTNLDTSTIVQRPQSSSGPEANQASNHTSPPLGPTFGQPSVLHGQPSPVPSPVPSADSIPTAARSSLKRAAAFEDGIKDAKAQKKRSFGHARFDYPDDECIIEASDNEAGEDVEHVGGSSAAAPSGSKVNEKSSNAATRAEKGQTLSDPPKSGADLPGLTLHNASPTPTQAASVNSEGKTLDLHERQILEMKKRIALIEQRKKAKLSTLAAISSPVQAAQHIPSEASVDVTPNVTEGSSAKLKAALPPEKINGLANELTLPTTDAPVNASAETPPEPQSHPSVQDRVSAANANSDIGTDAAPVLASNDISHAGRSTDVPSLPAPAASTTDVVQDSGLLKKRQADVKASLNDRQTKYQATLSKLEAMKAQVLELEETARKEQEDKDRLTAELEGLGIDTQHIAAEDLQQTRDDAVALIEAERDDEAVKDRNLDEDLNATITTDTIVQPSDVLVEKTTTEVASEAPVATSSGAVQEAPTDSPLMEMHNAVESDDTSMDESSDSSEESSTEEIAAHKPDGAAMNSSEGKLLDISGEQRSPVKTTAIENSEDDAGIPVALPDDTSDQMDVDDDSYEPQEVQPVQQILRNIVEPASSGEVSEGESIEEDHQTRINEVSTEIRPQTSSASDTSEDESEDYEPPETTEVLQAGTIQDDEDDEQESYEPPEAEPVRGNVVPMTPSEVQELPRTMLEAGEGSLVVKSNTAIATIQVGSLLIFRASLILHRSQTRYQGFRRRVIYSTTAHFACSGAGATTQAFSTRQLGDMDH